MQSGGLQGTADGLIRPRIAIGVQAKMITTRRN